MLLHFWKIIHQSTLDMILTASGHKIRSVSMYFFDSFRCRGLPFSSLTSATSHKPKLEVACLGAGRMHLLTAAACRHLIRTCRVFESRGDSITSSSIILRPRGTHLSCHTRINAILSFPIGFKAPARCRSCHFQASSCSFLSMRTRKNVHSTQGLYSLPRTQVPDIMTAHALTM